MVANRRSFETRIAVTLGTASLSNGGIGPLDGPEPTGEDGRVARPVSGLSAGRGGGFSTDELGFEAGADGLTADGVPFGAAVDALPACGIAFGAAVGALIAGADPPAGGTAPAARGTVGGGTLGDGTVTSGCTRWLGTVFVAFTTGGFDFGVVAGTRGPRFEDRGSFRGCPGIDPRASIFGVDGGALTAGGFDSGVFVGTRGLRVEVRGSLCGFPGIDPRASIFGAGGGPLAAGGFDFGGT
jgi:hypothetical protein